MRRNIQLYINDSLVDLTEDNLILLNYKAEELTKPSVVANSYSQQMTLPKTKENNIIFGHFFRSDRVTGTESFNAMRKTPFKIMSDTGELLEHGYIKLDEVSEGYKITLYGGLGSFFYGLSYDEQGNKKTLASLDYGRGENEFDITINKETIKRAWYSLKQENNPESTYHKINFAPCYNGLPSNFDANKVIVDADKARTRTGNADIFPATIDGASPYLSKYAMMQFEESRNEWIIGDLRSYLQRPVVNVKAVLDAIANPVNNGGYSVNFHTMVNDNIWVTLKSLSSINVDRNERRELENPVSLGGLMMKDRTRASLDVFTDLPLGADNVAVSFMPRIDDTRTLYFTSQYGNTQQVHATALVCQLVGYGNNDVIVSASPVVYISNSVDRLGIAESVEHFKTYGSEIYNTFFTGAEVQTLETNFADGELSAPITLTLSGDNVRRVELKAYYYVFTILTGADDAYTGLSTDKKVLGRIQPTWSVNAETGSYAEVSQSAIRSGMQVNKAIILKTDYTPADFLLSVAKLYHWHFYAEDEKTIGVYPSQITDKESIVDLSRFIDLSTKPSVTPVFSSARWFSLSLPVYGATGKAYKDKYGIEFGAKRVNTGFEFNADTTELMDNVIFKGAVQVLENNPLYNDFRNGTGNWLNLFRQKYTLTYGTGDNARSADFMPQSATDLIPFNTAVPNADTFSKIQLCDRENKPESGEGVLLALQTSRNWMQQDREYCLTDDYNELFSNLNGGKPCWILDYEDAYLIRAFNVPNFRRYELNNWDTLKDTLDFTLTSEIYDPKITRVIEGVSIYGTYWERYLKDRYNVDTRVMKCKVDLSSFKVNTDLFKTFYWFDNSLWVLNRINNYSLTTLDSTECEFIKVNNKENY